MAVLGATNLTGCNSIPDFIAGGSRMLFEQSTAPTSWVKDAVSHNNKALRVVTGTATPGGSTAFTTVFTSRTPAGTISGSTGQIAAGGVVNNTTLTLAQVASHSHTFTAAGGPAPNQPKQVAAQGPATSLSNPSTITTTSRGSDGAHNHPFSGSQHDHPISATFTGGAQDFAVQYVDIIIASKS
jgi:hypothetical protein